MVNRIKKLLNADFGRSFPIEAAGVLEDYFADCDSKIIQMIVKMQIKIQNEKLTITIQIKVQNEKFTIEIQKLTVGIIASCIQNSLNLENDENIDALIVHEFIERVVVAN